MLFQPVGITGKAEVIDMVVNPRIGRNIRRAMNRNLLYGSPEHTMRSPNDREKGIAYVKDCMVLK